MQHVQLMQIHLHCFCRAGLHDMAQMALGAVAWGSTHSGAGGWAILHLPFKGAHAGLSQAASTPVIFLLSHKSLWMLLQHRLQHVFRPPAVLQQCAGRCSRSIREWGFQALGPSRCSPGSQRRWTAWQPSSSGSRAPKDGSQRRPAARSSRGGCSSSGSSSTRCSVP